LRFSPLAATTPSSSWLASVDIPANTRIAAVHLVSPEFRTPAAAWRLPDRKTIEGKYALDLIPKGVEVTQSKLSPSPSLHQREGYTFVFYGSPQVGPLLVHLNANSKVYVCEEDKVCNSGPYQVETIIGAEASQVLVLRISNKDAEFLKKISKPFFRIASLS
jgi:hypothetical protein